MRGEEVGQQGVGAPPEKEEGAEEEGGGEAVVEAAEAVRAVDLARAVDGAVVESCGLVDGVLDLQAGFDVFDGGGDEGDGPAGKDAGEGVADGGEFR